MFTMMKIYVYSCLLSALCIAEMKRLNINGRVGENKTFTCSDWKSLTDVKSNVKYFCDAPCSKNDHIIVKAKFMKTKHKGRISLTNSAEGLFVTFTNIQKSDSKKYYCGAEKLGWDSLIEVNVKVTDVESSSPKTTPETVTVVSAVTNSSTTSSDAPDIITDTSPFHSTTTTTSATQAAGSAPYLIFAIVLITILMVLLILMRKMMKTKLKGEEDAREDVEYNEIRPEDQQTVSQPAGVSDLYLSADPDGLYANYSYHQNTELAAESGNKYSKDFSLYATPRSGVSSRGACTESRVTDPQCDLVYSLAQAPKEQIEPTGQSEPNQSKSNENDSLYSLVQRPQAT